MHEDGSAAGLAVPIDTETDELAQGQKSWWNRLPNRVKIAGSGLLVILILLTQIDSGLRVVDGWPKAVVDAFSDKPQELPPVGPNVVDQLVADLEDVTPGMPLTSAISTFGQPDYLQEGEQGEPSVYHWITPSDQQAIAHVSMWVANEGVTAISVTALRSDTPIPMPPSLSANGYIPLVTLGKTPIAFRGIPYRIALGLPADRPPWVLFASGNSHAEGARFVAWGATSYCGDGRESTQDLGSKLRDAHAWRWHLPNTLNENPTDYPRRQSPRLLWRDPDFREVVDTQPINVVLVTDTELTERQLPTPTWGARCSFE